MSSLNARHGWKFESYGESSNIPSGNLEIVLSSNLQTSPLIPSSPTLALQNIGDWYDNFSIDGGGPFASHGHTVHSDISSMTIPVREPLSDFLFFFHSDVELQKPGAMHLGKSAQPDVVESSFYELQDVIGSRQELACSPTMRAFSVDGAVSKRVTSRLQDKDDGEEVMKKLSS